jgi:hypothetical protein
VGAIVGGNFQCVTDNPHALDEAPLRILFYSGIDFVFEHNERLQKSPIGTVERLNACDLSVMERRRDAQR